MRVARSEDWEDLEPLMMAWLARNADEGGLTGAMRLNGGLWLGTVSQPPEPGCLHLEKSILRSVAVGAHITRATDQTIASGNSTAISFNSVRFDPLGMFAAAQPTRLTCRVSGVYLLIGQISFNQNSSGRRVSILRRGGSLQIALQTANGYSDAPSHVIASTLVQMEEGEYIELLAYQSSGGNLAVKALTDYSPELSAVRVA